MCRDREGFAAIEGALFLLTRFHTHNPVPSLTTSPPPYSLLPGFFLRWRCPIRLFLPQWHQCLKVHDFQVQILVTARYISTVPYRIPQHCSHTFATHACTNTKGMGKCERARSYIYTRTHTRTRTHRIVSVKAVAVAFSVASSLTLGAEVGERYVF